jgi:hypothetical protein
MIKRSYGMITISLEMIKLRRTDTVVMTGTVEWNLNGTGK